MSYELTVICDACGARATIRVNALGERLPDRPLPGGWTHVHRGGPPGAITPEIGIACSRACLPVARRALLAGRARTGGRPTPDPARRGAPRSSSAR